jgi:hypothetical protein
MAPIWRRKFIPFDLVLGDLSAVGQVLGFEVPSPAAVRVVSAAADVVVVVLVMLVMRVGDHLVGHVFLVVEKLLQADDRRQDERQLQQNRVKGKNGTQSDRLPC